MTDSESQAASVPFHMTLVLWSNPCYLPVVRAAVGQLAEVLGWNEADSRAITLAVDEALANVIRHAYHGRTDGRIELECLAALDELRFRIGDRGDAPDASRICARQVGCDEVGGLGTHIIRDVMDTVTYQSSAEGNWLTAAKRLRRQE